MEKRDFIAEQSKFPTPNNMTTTDTHWMIVLQLQKGECRIAETQTVDKQHYISVAIFSLFTNNYLAYTLKVCNITVTLRLE